MLGFSLTPSAFAQETATVETHFRACTDIPGDGDWYSQCHEAGSPLAAEPMTDYSLALNNRETGEQLVAETDSIGNASHVVPPGSYDFEGVPGHGLRDSHLACSMVDEHGQPTSTLDQPMNVEAGDHVVCDYYIVSADYSARPTEEATDPDSESDSPEAESENTGSEESTTMELENVQMHIVPADCTTTDVDASVAELSPLTIGTDGIIGSADAINVVTSWTSISVSVETLTGSDHALVLLNSTDGTVVACGNIGGVPGNDETLVIGLTSPRTDDETTEAMVGVAYLQPDGEDVSISVFVREDVVSTD